MEVTGMCGHDPQSRGSFSDKLDKEKRGSFSEDKRKIGGHLVRTLKRRWSFSEDFSLKEKSGSFREALNLSANFYLAITLILPSNISLYWVHITRWSFIGENSGCHSARA